VFWLALPVLAAVSSLWRVPLSGLISKLVGPREQGQASDGSQAMASLASRTSRSASPPPTCRRA